MGSPQKISAGAVPGFHHLDRRAGKIAAAEEAAGAADDLLTTMDVAAWLGVSVQFMEIGRHRGYGPPFVRITARLIRYKRGAVLKWLRQRSHASTSEYRPNKSGRAR